MRHIILIAILAIGPALLLPGVVAASEPLRPVSYEPRRHRHICTILGRKSDSPTSFRPRRDVEAWDAALPIDWGADPFHDRNWQFQLHAWRVMDYQLYEYREAENPAWLREAIEIALDWAHHHVELGNSEKFSWYDMATGIRASRLAFILDRIFPIVWMRVIASLKRSCFWRCTR